MAAYVGQTPQALQGGHVSDWFPSYHGNGNFEIYHRVYQTGQTQTFEQHYQGDGQDVWISTLVKKQGAQLLMSFMDLTQVRQTTEALRLVNQDLARSNQSLEQFAQVASHDLQEPLRKIISFGHLVQSGYGSQLDEQANTYLSRIQSAATRMQTLTQAILRYSRLAAENPIVEPVDLNQLVLEVLSDLETVLHEKGAQVRYAPFGIIRGDAQQLRQMLQNLISNALKFTQPDRPPVIELTCRTIAGYTIEAFLPAEAHYLTFAQLEVIDNGIGFAPQQSERIFQLFRRLHSRQQYEGTGLGLAIVKKVVENHHGYVIAEGRPGQGATFRVLLPVDG